MPQTDDALDAEFVNETNQPSSLIPYQQQSQGLMPALTIEMAVARFNQVIEFVRTVMKPKVDYGTIPGTDKATLLKPGAEKLCALFGLAPDFKVINKIEDWTGKEHNGEPFFYFHFQCLLMRDGIVIGAGDGSCNSWEKKYRYRDAQRKCPNCGVAAIFNSKNGPGFYCWNKRGGCGAKFPGNDPAITKQEAGRIANPDIFDQVNTIQKMASKRALIAATLMIGCVSELFTQDLEDYEYTPHGAAATSERQPGKESDGATRASAGEEGVTDKQLSAIYSIAKAKALDAELEAMALFKVSAENLTRSQASELIDHLRDAAPRGADRQGSANGSASTPEWNCSRDRREKVLQLYGSLKNRWQETDETLAADARENFAPGDVTAMSDDVMDKYIAHLVEKLNAHAKATKG